MSRAGDTRSAAYRLHFVARMHTNFRDITASLDDVHGGFKLPGWAQRAVDKTKEVATEAIDKGKQIATDIARTWTTIPVAPTLLLK